MKERVLLASINGEQIGSLHEVNGIWAFRYTEAWLKNPQRFALSPYLPLKDEQLLDLSTQRPVQWYFDNLLPEENQRLLLANDAHLDAADAFGLLGYYGSESAGSLVLLQEGIAVNTADELRPLSDQNLNNRILNLPKAPLNHAALKRMSLAGAQHKLAVVLQGNELFEPAGNTPSTHILKPDHQETDSYPHSVVNEWFVMRLAAKLKLDVPKVHRRYVPSPVYIIDRFDRVQDKHGWQRRHAIDACQLLGLDRSFKYSQASMDSLAALANACRGSAVTRTKIFGWLVFNVLVGNTDAHLKNLSFLVSSEGIQLAPHYDMLSTACYSTKAYNNNDWPDKTRLTWPILGVSFFADIDRTLLLSAGEALSLAESTAKRLLDMYCSRILDEAEKLYAEFEQENAALLEHRPALSATLAGESRCLRTIQHTIIKEMIEKLAG